MDPHTMPGWCGAERRGTAHGHAHMWGTTDAVPWLLLGTVFVRHTPYTHRPLAHSPCPGWASPGSADGGGRPQRRDPPRGREAKEPLSRARATPWLKKTLRLFAVTPPCLHQMRAGDAL
jgi:hypothetical protein